MSEAHSLSIPLTPVAPGRWTTFAATEWSNPGGSLWGGYAASARNLPANRHGLRPRAKHGGFWLMGSRGTSR